MSTLRKVLILATLALGALSSGGCFLRCLDIVLLRDDEALSCGGAATTIDVLANDIVPARYTVDTVSIPDPPAAATGTATVNGQSVLFTPASGASGAVTFHYQVSYHLTDDVSNTSQAKARVTINITSSSQPPVAGNDLATTPFNQPVLIDVLSNDSDPAVSGGGTQFLEISNLTTPTSGTVTQVGKKVLYTPAQDFSGSDSFQYTLSNACGFSAVGSVSVTVSPEPPPPPPAPAKVLLVNNSDFEITVFIGGVQIDIVQPHAVTPLPLDVAAGDNQEVRVEALVGMGDPRVTNNIVKLVSDISYTITYTDDNSNPPALGIEVTP